MTEAAFVSASHQTGELIQQASALYARELYKGPMRINLTYLRETHQRLAYAVEDLGRLMYFLNWEKDQQP
jgi:hypothetical protein